MNEYLLNNLQYFFETMIDSTDVEKIEVNTFNIFDSFEKFLEFLSDYHFRIQMNSYITIFFHNKENGNKSYQNFVIFKIDDKQRKVYRFSHRGY